MSEKGLQHNILADLKALALKLGHVPTRFEFIQQSRHTEWKIKAAFGNYTAAVIAAGLQVKQAKGKDSENAAKKQKIEHIFDHDIASHIADHSAKKPVFIKMPDVKSILIIGDCHFPFVCQPTLAFIYFWCDLLKPDVCVQIGDLYDMFSSSKFPRSRMTFNAHDEVTTGFQMATAMWKKIQVLSPGVECYQIRGNHDSRPLKRILECYPEGEIFFSIEKYFEFEGVINHADYRKELILEDIIFHHGYSSRLGAHREHNLKNTVVGHSHLGGVVYRNTFNGIIWELNAGFCGDTESKALSYTPQRLTKWTKGFGFIDALGPRFIPAGGK